MRAYKTMKKMKELIDDVGSVDKTYSEHYFNACRKRDKVQCKRVIGGFTNIKYSPTIVRIVD